MKDILNSYNTTELKRFISKTNIKGYSKLRKAEVIELMLKNAEKFNHIKMKPAKTKKEQPKKVEPKKVMPKKVEPKKVEPKKVEPKKVEPKKEMPKPKTNTEAELFYNNLNDYLKGSKRSISQIRKNHNFTDTQIKDIFQGQDTKDFYPTPDKCIQSYKQLIKNSNMVLEGTAGLGSVVYSMNKIKPTLSITANEINKNFGQIIKKFNPRVRIMSEDYLKMKNLKKYDTIFLNPPFSAGGKYAKRFGFKGVDKRFYLNFLYHTIIQLNKEMKGQNAGTKNILFVSPKLTDKREKEGDTILDEDIFNKMTLEKINSILKQEELKTLTPSEWKTFKEDGQLDGKDYLEDLLGATQINVIGECSGFGGTGVNAKLYNVIM